MKIENGEVGTWDENDEFIPLAYHLYGDSLDRLGAKFEIVADDQALQNIWQNGSARPKVIAIHELGTHDPRELEVNLVGIFPGRLQAIASIVTPLETPGIYTVCVPTAEGLVILGKFSLVESRPV